MSENRQGFFEGASPKLLFTFGLMVGVTAISIFAFMVTLGIAVDGTGGSSDTSNSDSDVAGVTDTTNTNPAPDDNSAKPINVDVTKVKGDAPLRGDQDAEITVVEFSDFQCPYCQRVHPTLVSLIQQNGKDVNWALQHLPLSFHPNAQPAAEASECANEQGKFWEFADAMFANQDRLGNDLYNEQAGTLGMNVDQFKKCVSDKKYASRVTDDLALSRTVGASGTPYFVIINNKTKEAQTVNGAQSSDVFQQAINALKS
ncbi:MAG: thioredoxin domain-containing protein [Candidatus Kerfeldbacteria bacterium]|nr:thioredoxin domain-containing protein [Candidatus Kerfeldbacteria bacterium]